MESQILGHVIWFGLLALVSGVFALSLPYRREWRFSVRRMIATPRENVWNTYHPGADHPDHAAFHSDVVSNQQVSSDPVIWEQVVDSSGGHGTELMTLRFENVAESAPELSAIRACEIDDTSYPFGRAHTERLELRPHPNGTLATLSWQGETATPWQALHIRRSNNRYLRKLQAYCETGATERKIPKGRALWTSLVLSVLAVGSFTLVLGWVGGLLLTGILVVHEFGHWLAMRMTGQPSPKVLLIPFFGGAAVANHRHRTLFDDAFCALMGPGFSTLPALAFLLVAVALGVPDMSGVWTTAATGERIMVMPALSGSERVALSAAAIAGGLGLINMIQVVPVLPLDGGQVLRALMQSFSAKWARWILLLVTGSAAAGLVLTGDYILGGVIGLGALQAWHMGAEPTKARPMSVPGATVIALGYGLTVACHAFALLYGLELIGFQWDML